VPKTHRTAFEKPTFAFVLFRDPLKAYSIKEFGDDGTEANRTENPWPFLFLASFSWLPFPGFLFLASWGLTVGVSRSLERSGSESTGRSCWAAAMIASALF